MNPHTIIVNRIHVLVSTLQMSEYDRFETTICGCIVRAWRTKINGKTVLHFGYRTAWAKQLQECKLSELSEILVRRSDMLEESFDVKEV
jgi:hypothetical protein